MANVSISIRRDNGTSVSGDAEVDDELVVDIASMLGAMIFSASSDTQSVPELPVTPLPKTV